MCRPTNCKKNRAYKLLEESWFSWAILMEAWSYFLGLLDLLVGFVAQRLGAFAKLLPSESFSLLFCNQGMGEIDKPVNEMEDFVKAVDNNDLDKIQSLSSLDAQTLESRVLLQRFLGIHLQEVTFESPAADLLPDESKRSHYWLVKPTSTSSSKPVYVLYLASTGEISMFPRIIQAWYWATVRGWTTILLTTPLYGIRKPKNDGLFPSTLELALSQHIALVQESAAITRYYLREQFKSSRVCITGFSVGGGMSIYAAALALLAGCDGHRISIASYGGAVDPSEAIAGCISNMVDWDALSASLNSSSFLEKESFSCMKKVKKTAIAYVKEPQRQYEIAIRAVSKQGKNTIQTMRLVSFLRDGFISPKSSLALNQTSKGMMDKEIGDIRATWKNGGHVVAAFARPVYHTLQVMDAVDSHERQGKKIA